MDGTAMFFRSRGRKKQPAAVLDRGITTEFPPNVLPDCPPGERAAAVAAVDAMHRTRPLKPPGASACRECGMVPPLHKLDCSFAGRLVRGLR